MSYFVFKQLSPRAGRKQGRTAVAAVREFGNRTEAVAFAQRRCRLTGGVYQITSDNALVHMGPQVIECRP